MNTGELAIGVDIGGTKIAAGLVDVASGQLLDRVAIATNPDRGGKAVFDDIWQVIATVRRAADAPIGIALPELVDRAGAVRSSHVMDWAGFDTAARLNTSALVTLESDVRAAAVAESRFGAGKGVSSFIYVSIGTGISSCLVIDGQPFAGHRGNALVLASSPVVSVCRVCGETTEFIPEEIASGPGLVERYRERTGVALAGAEDVLALSDDPVARDVVIGAAEMIARHIGMLIDGLDPELLVIGGGLGSAPGLYWETLQSAIRPHVWSEETRQLPIVRSVLGPDTGVIGAAIVATLRRAGRIPQGVHR